MSEPFIDLHTCGKKTDDPAPTADRDCPDCKTELEPEYGFCDHGLGAFDRCMTCYRVFNFKGDDGS